MKANLSQTWLFHIRIVFWDNVTFKTLFGRLNLRIVTLGNILCSVFLARTMNDHFRVCLFHTFRLFHFKVVANFKTDRSFPTILGVGEKCVPLLSRLWKKQNNFVFKEWSQMTLKLYKVVLLWSWPSAVFT